ncbi:MAG: AMP-binding protein [Akkermansiaceae bacterium]
MDTAYLTSSEFWKSDTCHVMVNDRDPAAVAQSEIIRSWCQDNDQFREHLLFSTSGSTGDGKWVTLSRSALLASAHAVNEHLQVTENDHWLLALPTFHVGGMGIIARAHLASCKLSLYQESWNVTQFHKALGNEITLTSLVPTQLTDLVDAHLTAPECLCAVLIGGGALSDDVYQQAIELGWPVIETYGMTEASSQIATASILDRKLKVLPCWQTRTDADGLLSIKGEPLLSAYLKVENGKVTRESPLTNGWFTTSDRVKVENDHLVFKGRSDRCAKVLGELVDLAGVESGLKKMLGRDQVAVVAVPDQRKGSRLVAFIEGTRETHSVDQALAEYNRVCSPVARVESILMVNAFPRTALGKLRYAKLVERFHDDETLAE